MSPALPAQNPSPRAGSEPLGTGSYSIRGSLRHADDHPAEMVKVHLLQLSGEPVTMAFTRPNGEFEFRSIPSGVYLIAVEEDGFEPIQERIDARVASRVQLHFYLREKMKFGAVPVSPSVSARELALSPTAAEELRKGKEQLFEKKDPAKGLKHFEKLASEAPDFYEAHHFRGLALSSLKRPQEAEAALREAIAGSGGTYASSHVALASLLCNQKRYAEAEPLARRGIELDPDSWQGHFELARALDGQNRPDEALLSVQVVRQRQADFPELFLLLVNIHLHRNDAQGVVAAADGYLKLAPGGPASDKVRETRQKVLAQVPSASARPPE